MGLFRSKRFSGGMFFSATKAASVDTPIQTLSDCGTLRVPLSVAPAAGGSWETVDPRSGDEAATPEFEVLVKPGARVKLSPTPASRSPTLNTPDILSPSARNSATITSTKAGD